MEHEGDGDANCSWGTWNCLPGLVEGTGRNETTALLRSARIQRRVLET